MKTIHTKRNGKATYHEMREYALRFQRNGYTVRIKKDAEHGFHLEVTGGPRGLW